MTAVVVALALLLDVTGSNTSDATLKVLTMLPAAFAVTSIAIVAEPGNGTLPSEHVTESPRVYRRLHCTAGQEALEGRPRMLIVPSAPQVKCRRHARFRDEATPNTASQRRHVRRAQIETPVTCPQGARSPANWRHEEPLMFP